MTNTLRIHEDDKHRKQYHGFPYPEGVDIFPLDRLPEEREEEEFFLKLIEIVQSVLLRYDEDEEKQKEISGLLPQVEKLCGIHLNYQESIPEQLAVLVDQLSKIYIDGDSEYMSFIGEYCCTLNWKMKRVWYEETIYLPFEGIQLPCPKQYDSVLRAWYGDYKRHIKGITSHNYPFIRNICKSREDNIK